MGSDPKISNEAPTRRPRKVAMDLLARREHSVAELKQKLTARQIPAEEADAAVARLAGEGLVSDQRFALAFIHSRIGKGQGPVRIRAELERRGVAGDQISSAFDEVSASWAALAHAVCRKKFGAAAPADARERARRMRFLQYRGFTHEQIRAAITGAGDDDC